MSKDIDPAGEIYEGRKRRYTDPLRGALPELERCLIRHRALQMILIIYHAEELKRDVINGVAAQARCCRWSWAFRCHSFGCKKKAAVRDGRAAFQEARAGRAGSALGVVRERACRCRSVGSRSDHFFPLLCCYRYFSSQWALCAPAIAACGTPSDQRKRAFSITVHACQPAVR